jgi:hypothetical protein
MAFQFAMYVKKSGPRTHSQLKCLRVDLNLVHEPEINEYSSAGRYGSAISPSSCAPYGYRDFMISGKCKDPQKVFFSGRLKNDIRQALQHEVPDRGREINVKILAVIFKLPWIIDHLQTGIPDQERFE